MPSPYEGFAHCLSRRLRPHVANEGRPPAQARIAAGRVATGLAYAVEVLREVRFPAPVEVGAGQVDVGVDARVPDDDDFGRC